MVERLNMVDVEKIEFIEEFQKRTKEFSQQAIQIFKKLPKKEESQIIGKQFIRSALSVGADDPAGTKAELFAKLSIPVLEERMT